MALCAQASFCNPQSGPEVKHSSRKREGTKSWRAIEDPPPVATDLNLGLSLDLDCNLEPGLGGSRTLATGSDRRRRQPSFS
ncbi:hypothetical protein CGLO_07483 [Colletotrichum gloeosporioides Cg-14]|uniref:Uncharacterized protein n=1 Tax=Colletotrichum gloeosporioides (strain Cg-14) TaxID=1237896 RepID=T0LMC5_COLGC|nr:hypothetical protein CGLO_07483 [Colletotrichum gloeosporioides Cg-14]